MHHSLCQQCQAEFRAHLVRGARGLFLKFLFILFIVTGYERVAWSCSSDYISVDKKKAFRECARQAEAYARTVVSPSVCRGHCRDSSWLFCVSPSLSPWSPSQASKDMEEKGRRLQGEKKAVETPKEIKLLAYALGRGALLLSLE